VPDRLSALSNYPNTLALVAADGDEVVGIVTAHVFPALHAAEPVAWLTSMVVSDKQRSRGIGSELIERAEQWAMEKGALKISLTSALHREGAHAFYELKQGYEKTGLRFSKILGEER
jgi:predicted N-acetyltransferase YhbS